MVRKLPPPKRFCLNEFYDSDEDFDRSEYDRTAGSSTEHGSEVPTQSQGFLGAYAKPENGNYRNH